MFLMQRIFPITLSPPDNPSGGSREGGGGGGGRNLDLANNAAVPVTHLRGDFPNRSLLFLSILFACRLFTAKYLFMDEKLDAFVYI